MRPGREEEEGLRFLRMILSAMTHLYFIFTLSDHTDNLSFSQHDNVVSAAPINCAGSGFWPFLKWEKSIESRNSIDYLMWMRICVWYHFHFVRKCLHEIVCKIFVSSQNVVLLLIFGSNWKTWTNVENLPKVKLYAFSSNKFINNNCVTKYKILPKMWAFYTSDVCSLSMIKATLYDGGGS